MCTTTPVFYRDCFTLCESIVITTDILWEYYLTHMPGNHIRQKVDLILFAGCADSILQDFVTNIAFHFQHQLVRFKCLFNAVMK